jgi:hypothetical protein
MGPEGSNAMVRQAFDNPYDNASDPGSAIAGRTAGQNANYAKMYELSVTVKVAVLSNKLKETFKMRHLLIAACAVVVSTPVFADGLFDTCSRLATDLVGPIGKTVHGHFQKFVQQYAYASACGFGLDRWPQR